MAKAQSGRSKSRKTRQESTERPAESSAKANAASSRSTKAKSSSKAVKARRAKAAKSARAGKDKSNKRKSESAIVRPTLDSSRELSLEERLGMTKGTTARAIISARIAVEAIASEKTTSTRAAQKEADDLGAAELAVSPVGAVRRCRKDPFDRFRDRYTEYDPNDPFTDWRQLNQKARHELGSGAPFQDLLEAERLLSVGLSPSYWDFSLEWGSGLIFTSNWRETRFISGLDVRYEAKSVLKDAMLRPFLPIVCLGPSDYLALDTSTNKKGEYPVVWWSLEDTTVQVKVADSFGQWIELAEACYGDHYWLGDHFP
jgi:hypothetical protein